ncbi:MAG: hypothetical protein ABWY80_06685 [Acidimicrobiia bacterium]
MEAFETYAVGDDVWCLAWIGMPFVVVGKDDDHGVIHIDGTGACSLPEGARLDIVADNLFMLTHEPWDSIWYWPDIAGERYKEVTERFVDAHRDGEVVVAYSAGLMSVVPSPARAMSFRLGVDSYWPSGVIYAQPVAAIAADGTELLVAHDPSVEDARWLPCGPRQSVELRMVAFRWALTYGKLVLNWQDFA